MEILLKVQSNIAGLLLNIFDDITLDCGGEGIPMLQYLLDQDIGQIMTSKFKMEDGVGESETVNGDGVTVWVHRRLPQTYQ